MSAQKGNEEVSTEIGPQSKVSVALLGGIFVVLAGVSWQASRWAAQVDYRLSNIENIVEQAVGSQWTARDMAQWTERLREMNPSMKTPAVTH